MKAGFSTVEVAGLNLSQSTVVAGFSLFKVRASQLFFFFWFNVGVELKKA